jgi:hypothetical protein
VRGTVAIVAGAIVAVALVGCGVGEGEGHVSGPLTLEDCGGPGKMLPDPSNPQEYDMDPRFFAAEQLLDLTGGVVKSNRLIIRLQNTGRRREANDVLRFDIPNLFEVARCVHGGRKADGSPDFDEANCSGGRIRIGTNALIRSYLTPNFKCSTKVQMYDHVGTAISNDALAVGDNNWESFIVFEAFGGAKKPDPPGPNFKIDIDDQLHATHFQLTIEDDAVVTARLDPLKPIPPHSFVHGSLQGDFDFVMQRGQGAQTFP